MTLISVPSSLLGAPIVYGGLFLAVSFELALLTAFWYSQGVYYYGQKSLGLAPVVLLAPLVIIVHSLGTVVGTIDPPKNFCVTRKNGVE